MNVVTLSGPSPTQQLVSQFLDQFNANHRANQQNALGRDELAQREKAQADTAAYQQGTLKDAQDKFALIKQQYADANLKEQAKQYVDRIASYHDAIQSMQPNDPQRAALETQAKSEAASIPPELLPYVKIATLEPILTPQRQEQLATQGVKTGAAQGMRGGNPTPMQADVFSKENFKKDMSPEMVKDIQSRQPEASPAPAGQTPSPTTDYYRGPALGLDTTAAQDQVAQTAITDTKLQGSAQRDVAAINAKSALAVAGVNAAKVTAGGVNPDDAKAIAGEIIAGRQPPHVEARIAGPVRGALAAQHYDLMKATQDWAATQKYLSTMNGAGQVRLRQAVDFAYESLPVVDSLAKEWQAGGFPLLNKARMLAAEHGVLGPQAQQIATKLNSQIIEMQAELAVVYRGGNSPTDEAMKQAAHVLQADWSLPTLQANLGLLSQNLLIRRNSIVSAGAATGAGNNYAPNVTIAPPAGMAPRTTTGGGNPLGLTPPGARP